MNATIAAIVELPSQSAPLLVTYATCKELTVYRKSCMSLQVAQFRIHPRFYKSLSTWELHSLSDLLRCCNKGRPIQIHNATAPADNCETSHITGARLKTMKRQPVHKLIFQWPGD